MTKTALFNRALGLIGHNRTIPEGNVAMTEYLRCDQEWDGARLSVLTAHDWNWLIEETAITEGAESTDDVSNELEYTYDRPDDAVRLVAVMDGYNKRVAYRVAGGVIYSAEPELKFSYLPDETDPTNWPQAIVDAVASELASRVAYAMTANAKAVQAMKQLAIGFLYKAIETDSAEMRRAGSDGDKYARSRR